ncbi:hypothetical protein V6N11_044499 [Hibiscus sabdariffa]|uniref:Reverse transcriptase Ty1/copia-type domain-containing protein n=1 Tax=Hibiscus sabdariffa TaxID=183260 RepID=A0ABR2RFC5_9ROSI
MVLLIGLRSGWSQKGPNGEKLVSRLKKALYGLQQASRACFDTLKELLVNNLGFSASKADTSLYIRNGGSSSLLLMISSSHEVIRMRGVAVLYWFDA